MCAALARSLMIWIKQDDVGHEFIAHQLAQFESIVSADMQARAEAAEALLIAKDEVLKMVTSLPTDEFSSPNQCALVVAAMDALAMTPEKMRSVIAGLSEDKQRLDWLDSECEVEVLTSCAGTPIVQHNAFLNAEHAGKLREAIDAARKAQP